MKEIFMFWLGSIIGIVIANYENIILKTSIYVIGLIFSFIGVELMAKLYHYKPTREGK